MPARTRGQAVVEFGIVALLFTLLMFAVVDFGMLLNTWLAVSSGSRELARTAAVGKKQPFLQSEAQHLNLPAVSALGFSKACCDATSAVEVRVEYLDHTCVPSPSSCAPFGQTAVDPQYPYPDVDHTTTCGGGCHPVADDLVRITVVAHGAQVITPLVRPFFGCTDGVNPNCNVTLTSTTLMRYEGQPF